MAGWSRSLGVGLAVFASCAGIVLFGPADAAFAKILPVTSIEVATARPTVGHPVEVLVRFGANFELGDAEWENHEIAVVPAGRADARGWPRNLTDPGTPVPLRRIRKGLFRGAFTMREPGDYVVFAWSSVHARQDRLYGVVTNGRYATPVRLRINRVAPIADRRVARHGVHSSSPTSLALWVAAIVLAIDLAAVLAIRRLRSHKAVTTAR